MSYKYIFFDVANTLLHKPALFEHIQGVLKSFGYETDDLTIRQRHKLLSECISFPDKTSKEFYQYFNQELLFSLGIIPKQELIDEIFNKCSYLPWQKFDDTAVLDLLKLPVGIISNWDKSLSEKLKNFFKTDFFSIIVSEQIGVKKPEKAIFNLAIKDLPCSPEEIIYVGDSLKLDMKPALEIGMKAVLVDRDGIFASYKGDKIASLNELKHFGLL